jgi:hypothetical protein
MLIATREPVISRHEDLRAFLNRYPLREVYDDENAFLLSEYKQCITAAGMRLRQVLGPYDSPINVFAMSKEEWLITCRTLLMRMLGARNTYRLTDPNRRFGRWVLGKPAASASRVDETPGRLYSFVAVKRKVGEGRGQRAMGSNLGAQSSKRLSEPTAELRLAIILEPGRRHTKAIDYCAHFCRNHLCPAISGRPHRLQRRCPAEPATTTARRDHISQPGVRVFRFCGGFTSTRMRDRPSQRQMALSAITVLTARSEPSSNAITLFRN